MTSDIITYASCYLPKIFNNVRVLFTNFLRLTSYPGIFASSGDNYEDLDYYEDLGILVM